MSVDHDTGRRRQLETASSSDVLESDEQLARRLHEELNALTRHARRTGPAAAPQPQLQLQRSRSEKVPDSKISRSGNKQRMPSDVEGQLAQADKADKPARKRSMLNRELAMLVTDMVDSQLKPATGPRQAKSKDEQVVDQLKGSEQQQHLLHGVEQLLPILKHESSSSQSEQERLALEHVQAAGLDGTPQANKAQQRQHFAARASDSGADAAGDSTMSGATSSGRDSSSSSGEADHGQQHTSPAAADQRSQPQQDRREQQPQRSRSQQAQPRQQQQALPGQGKGKQLQQDSNAGKVIKIPKLPMVEYAKKWYRAKVLKDAGSKVLLEYQGYSHEGGPFWLPKDHSRIWRGSYKGRDWKYLGDGAWEPKANKHEGKSRRVKVHRSGSTAAAAVAANSEGAAAADSDTEQVTARPQRRQAQQQQQQQRQKKQSLRRAGTAAAAESARQEDGCVDGAVSERDTTSADQQGGPADDADAAGPSAAVCGDPAEVDSPMQLEDVCEGLRQGEGQQQEPGQQDDAEQDGRDVEGEAQRPPCDADAEVTDAAAPMDVDQQEAAVAAVAAGTQQEAVVGAQQEQQGVKHPVEMQLAANKEASAQLPGSTKVDKGATAAEPAGEEHVAAAAAATVKLPAFKCEAEASEEAKPAVAADAAQVEGMAAVAAVSEKQGVKQDACAAAAPGEGAGRVKAAATKATKAKPSTSPLLLGHTHEEMVAAAAAAVAAAAPPAPRGRFTRSGRSNSIRSNGDGVSESTSRRGGRGRGNRGGGAAAQAAAAAAKEQQARQSRQEEAQQQQQQCVQQPAASGSGSGSGSGQGVPAGLRVEPGRALKHSGSSEGPLSPTSPSGGSPRAHRRKGVPRRARLDSEDLQRPSKKARGTIKPSVYCDMAMEYQQHEQQVQMQQMLEERRQQAQVLAQQQQAAWKAACKAGYGSSSANVKQSMWQMQQQGDYAPAKEARPKNGWQQEQQQQGWGQPSPRQQTLAAAAAAAAAAECQAAVAEQQQLLLLHQNKLQGSEPEDVEAACVLLGAAMGRAQSGEVLGMTELGAGFGLQLTQRSLSMTAADDLQLSPRYAGRQGGKRRGHNWSKPLNTNSRPPRPPAQCAGQQQFTTAFRHSFNGSVPHQVQQHQQQRRVSFSNAELSHAHSINSQEHLEQPSYGALGSAALAAAAAAAAAAALLSRQAFLGAATLGSAVPKLRNGTCVGVGGESSKQETLRNLLDAVGQVQSASGRPDLMYPMQFGGVPMGTQPPNKPAKNGVLQPLQLSHTPVSTSAATLLAAVPSLDAVQRLAMLHGQGGVMACLTGESPALFL